MKRRILSLLGDRLPLAVCVLVVVASCHSRSTPPDDATAAPHVRRGTEIVAAGQFFDAGTPVRLWLDDNGYDAYDPRRKFEPAKIGARDRKGTARHGTRRNLSPAIAARVATDGWNLADLRAVVHQVVLHYDAAGTSRNAFRVLHDLRGLSSHFLLDLDGTVYQTLDLQERAWHAGRANDGSIGIEIAHIGAYADPAALTRWYRRDGTGLRFLAPEPTGMPAGFVARPVRSQRVAGRLHGAVVHQYDFTEAQYVALGRLLRALGRAFPRVRVAVPRAADGSVLPAMVEPEAKALAFEGVVGHYHLTKAKVDPGPAFQWERVLSAMRATEENR